MTEYEIADLALSTQEIFWQQMQFGQGSLEQVYDLLQQFGNLLFGYLIVSYFVGAQLTRVQAAILTVLYLFWQVRVGIAINAVATNANFILVEMEKISPEFDPATPSIVGVYTLLILLTLASLYFMWSVRHPKKE